MVINAEPQTPLSVAETLDPANHFEFAASISPEEIAAWKKSAIPPEVKEIFSQNGCWEKIDAFIDQFVYIFNTETDRKIILNPFLEYLSQKKYLQPINNDGYLQFVTLTLKMAAACGYPEIPHPFSITYQDRIGPLTKRSVFHPLNLFGLLVYLADLQVHMQKERIGARNEVIQTLQLDPDLPKFTHAQIRAMHGFMVNAAYNPLTHIIDIHYQKPLLHSLLSTSPQTSGRIKVSHSAFVPDFRQVEALLQFANQHTNRQELTSLQDTQTLMSEISKEQLKDIFPVIENQDDEDNPHKLLVEETFGIPYEDVRKLFYESFDDKCNI